MLVKRLFLGTLLVGFWVGPMTAQKLSHDELLEVLEIRSWRVPVPRDERYIWSFEVVEARPRKRSLVELFEWAHPTERALITFRPDKEDLYQFTIKQRGGSSSGVTRVSPCGENATATSPCADSYSIEWHDELYPVDDGKSFVLAEVEATLGESRKKQLILVLTKHRLEDLESDQ